MRASEGWQGGLGQGTLCMMDMDLCLRRTWVRGHFA